MPGTATAAPKRVLLAAPRGYCAGVDRAVQTVERALELHGAPVYVRKEIVHNKHVVEELAKRGAIFVEQETEVPEGAIVVFSAHGVAPAVHENAAARNLRTIDATCPLVTKVHVSARRFAAQGYTIVMIGHEGHEEVEGTTGEAPDSIVLIETADEVEALEVPDPDKVAFITQTTLSVDETAEVIAALRAKFPGDRQLQVRRHLLRDDQPPDRRQAARPRVRPGPGDRLDQLLQLQPPGRGGPRTRRRLAPDRQPHPGRRGLAGGVETVGITSGASAPEELVESLVAFFRERGADDVSELRTVHEDVRFMLPKEIREAPGPAHRRPRSLAFGSRTGVRSPRLASCVLELLGPDASGGVRPRRCGPARAGRSGVQHQVVAVGVGEERHVADAGVVGVAFELDALASSSARAAATSSTCSARWAFRCGANSPNIRFGSQIPKQVSPTQNSKWAFGSGRRPSVST